MNTNPWQNPQIITWNQYLLNSYYTLLGHQLIERKNDPQSEAKELFFVPFVVVSHGTQSPPIFNYGNRTALNLWEMSWEQFTQTPSQQSAGPEQRDEREELLKLAAKQGYLTNIRGLRISRTGQRFWIENVTVWNVLDQHDQPCGQAATYPQWTFIDS